MRAEFAGALVPELDGGYVHYLDGPCRCGKTHASALSVNGYMSRDNGDGASLAQHERVRSRAESAPSKRVVNERRWKIADRDGHVQAHHCRLDFDDGSKRIWWEQKDGAMGLGGIAAADLPPYGAHEWQPDRPTIHVEGEHARDALAPLAGSLGVNVIAHVTGAPSSHSNNSLRPLLSPLHFLWSDSDSPGQTQMERTHDTIRELMRDELGIPHTQSQEAVRCITWDGARSGAGDDAADFVAQGGTVEELQGLLDLAQPVAGSDGVHVSLSSPRARGPRAAIIEDHPAPDFPLDVFPPALRPYVQASPAGLGVPAEMVATPTLGIVGGLIGNRLHMILKSDYRQYSGLTIAIVAPPGTAKTPSLEAAARPVYILQDQERAAHLARLVEYEADLAAWKATGRQVGAPEPARPQMRHYYSSDLTVEALAGILGHVPGISIIRDEITAWVASMDQYKGGKGSDRQQFLSLWSSQAWKIDRKHADPIYIRNPVASIVGGIQTDLVSVLHDAAGRRDGFVERILPDVPDVAPSPWSEESATLGQLQDAVALYQALDRALDHLQSAPDAHQPSFATGIGVNLSPEARALYVSWFNQNQALIESAPPLTAGFFAKLPSQVARIALILHALWNAEDPRPMLSVERMVDAIEVGEFFRAHIGRFLALLQTNDSAPARTAGTEARIQRILRKSDPGASDGWVNRSAILNGLRTVSAHDLTAALNRMLAAGDVERRLTGPDSKPAEQWRLIHSPFGIRNSEDPTQPVTGDPNTPNSEFGAGSRPARAITPVLAQQADGEDRAPVPQVTPLSPDASFGLRSSELLNGRDVHRETLTHEPTAVSGTTWEEL